MVTPSNSRISPDLAPEVLALAARLQAQQQDSYTLDELVEAGAEAHIPPEYIHQAVQQLQNQHSQTRRLPFSVKDGVIAAAFIIPLLSIATLLNSSTGMGCHAMMRSEEQNSSL